jgi:chromosome partitioning protein
MVWVMLISTINQKGGVGKSTLAVTTAVWLYDRGNRVALLDTDGQAASWSWIARAEPAVVRFKGTDAAEIARALAICRDERIVVVADGPPGLDARSQLLAVESDLILMPMGPSQLDVNATVQALESIDAFGRQQRQGIWVVLNRMRAGVQMSKMTRDVMPALGARVATATLGLREAYATAVVNGTVVTRPMKDTREQRAALAAACEINALLNEVLPDELTQPHAGDRQTDADAGGRPGPAERDQGAVAA